MTLNATSKPYLDIPTLPELNETGKPYLALSVIIQYPVGFDIWVVGISGKKKCIRYIFNAKDQ